MSKLKQMLLATAAMCAAAQSYDPYFVNRKEGMTVNPDYKVKSSTKELSELP